MTMERLNVKMSDEREKGDSPLPKKVKVEIQSDEEIDPLDGPHFEEIIKTEPTVKIEQLEDEEISIKEEVVEENYLTQASISFSKKTQHKMEQPRTRNKNISEESQKNNSVNIQILKTHIFQFKITLLRGKFIKTWRSIQVPGSYTFREFHVAIQKAMGWKSVEYDYHLHAFEVENPETGATDSIVTADDVNVSFRAPDQVVKNEDTTPIVDYFTKLMQMATYEYDFGMGWEHQILLEQILRPDPQHKYPRCLGGQKACPPEDGVVGSDEEYDSDEFDPKLCFP